MKRASITILLTAICATSSAAAPETRQRNAANHVQVTNGLGQVLRLQRHQDGYYLALSIPGIPPEDLNRFEPIVTLSSHADAGRPISAMYGDQVFEWAFIWPEPRLPDRLCSMWPAYEADEGCEDLPSVQTPTIFQRLPSAAASPQIGEFLKALPQAKMVRVSYVTPEGRKHATFIDPKGFAGVVSLLP